MFRNFIVLLSSALWCLSLLAGMPQALAQTPFEQSLRQVLSQIKQREQDKSQHALAALADQVQSDFDPAKRLQASIMLAAFYWDSNYRMSRTYLSIAESLRNPLVPELSRFDANIEHLKIRFRHAALLDLDTKRELEFQLKANPPEPLRLSLVEMLLDTSDTLTLGSDFLSCYHHYYARYPRTVRKDRFVKKAADIYYKQGNYAGYFGQLETLLDQYPVSDEAIAALDSLIDHAKGKIQPAYAFTFSLMRKVFRNSSHDPDRQERILSLATSPLRKTTEVPAHFLDTMGRIRLYTYLQLYDEAIGQAQKALNQPNVTLTLKTELNNWVAFIQAEKGQHSEALLGFAAQPNKLGPTETIFQESQAKSYMSLRQFPEAAKIYSQLIARKEQPRYRWYYFWSLLAGGSLESAKNFIFVQGEKIFTEIEFKRDAAVYWRGKAALSVGNFTVAQKTFSSLLEKDSLGYYGTLAKAALVQSQRLALAQANALRETNELVEPQSPKLAAKPLLAKFQSLDLQGGPPQLEPMISVPSPSSNAESIPFMSYIHETSKVLGVDPFLILSIIRSESAFNSRALSSAGAQGLMQLMPYTAVRLARLLDDQEFRLDQLQVTNTNILYGSLYLSMLLHYFNGHEIPAIAAYNAGPQVVTKWLKECRNCPVDAFVEFIPYAETRNYVKKVISAYSGYHQKDKLSEPNYFFKELPTEFAEGTIF